MSERPKKRSQKLTARRVLFQWRFPVIIVIFLIVLCCIPVGFLTYVITRPKEPDPPTSVDLYQKAVYDTLIAENYELPSEMSPAHTLVTLDPASLTVDHDGNGRVLLCTWHRNPEIYPAGTDVTLNYGNITAVSYKELADWYSNRTHQDEFKSADAGGKDGGTQENNVDTRLQQLFGLPPLSGDTSAKNTHFTIFWVNPESVVRPAYSSDVMSANMTNSLQTASDDPFSIWFASNALYYYTTINQAWTRLGYTYDWYYEDDEKLTPAANAARHFGLTEFLVNNEQSIHVVSTLTTDAFIQQLATDSSVATADTNTDANSDANANGNTDQAGNAN